MKLLQGFWLAVLLLWPLSVLSAAERPPNVVIFLADDQGWGDVSMHGNTNLATPNIDSLAKQGALFDRFYVCPVCAPTRAEFLTGRYHPRGGVGGVSTGRERLDLDETTIGQIFQAAGYKTGAFGKWHNGMQSPYHPNDRGFDEYYGFCSGHWGHYFSPQLEHNGELVRGNGYVTDDFTGQAIRFMEENQDQPFFCYLPYCTPHSPMQVPDRNYQKFDGMELKKRHREPKQEDVPKTRAALAMVENIDENVGRVLKKLEELNLDENTIVIYFSDNGPNSWRWNGGMRGRKGSTDEGGVRVPMMIRYPKAIQPGTKIPHIAGAIDLLPTLVALTGIKAEYPKPLDGINLAPLFSAEQGKAWPDRLLFHHWAGRVSVRSQQYRLDNKGNLYDMVADPGQTTAINKQQPQVAKRLSQALENWKQEVLSQMTRKTRPFTVGYSETTPLPARDGVPHGKVKRSNRAPNCSYFTNWKTPEDKITWDITVGESGTYEAVVHYTCAKENVGAQIRVSCQDAQASCEVTEVHDPPLYGKQEDRVDRGSESYVKDFKPLKIGKLVLESGPGTLTLDAVEVPGNEVIDVRYVMLKKISK